MFHVTFQRKPATATFVCFLNLSVLSVFNKYRKNCMKKHEMFLWQVTGSVLYTLQVRIYSFTDFWVYTFQTQYSPWLEVYPTCVNDKVEYVMPEACVLKKFRFSI